MNECNLLLKIVYDFRRNYVQSLKGLISFFSNERNATLLETECSKIYYDLKPM